MFRVELKPLLRNGWIRITRKRGPLGVPWLVGQATFLTTVRHAYRFSPHYPETKCCSSMPTRPVSKLGLASNQLHSFETVKFLEPAVAAKQFEPVLRLRLLFFFQFTAPALFPGASKKMCTAFVLCGPLGSSRYFSSRRHFQFVTHGGSRNTTGSQIHSPCTLRKPDPSSYGTGFLNE